MSSDLEARYREEIVIKYLCGCERCGGDHENLSFKKLQRPSAEWSHWTLCPNTGEPIMLAIVEDVPDGEAGCDNERDATREQREEGLHTFSTDPRFVP